MLNRKARYSVVKDAIECGPMTRRGSLSPTWIHRNAARRQAGPNDPVVPHLIDLPELLRRPDGLFVWLLVSNIFRFSASAAE